MIAVPIAKNGANIFLPLPDGLIESTPAAESS
jgi:hypothetical protein